MSALLTSREMEVATYKSAGLSNKQIAEKLFRSPHTVKAILRKVYEKLNINTETQLVAEWFIIRFRLCRADVEHALSHPHIHTIVFFLLLSIAQLFIESPVVRVRTARASRSVRSGRKAGRRNDSDLYLDDEGLLPTPHVQPATS